ncbi:hypothetical protein A9264_06545 [Vibrio sp. UCD-FRSSP16_10]|uniref:DUF3833 domain-containing protein n=1 Tax=unclassified Vibrio TaxID=2614977 RepID=UPI0008017B05|nr:MULTISPECIES: DUF3833 domain-containing protein [unclassified Vibrio]OBT15938.1 hypothetical protein A9264_06545 [Vibrio sp. UCD-FRSSP16_10]OBT17832.1 hypothetical protein A9260_00540 [Vibrio sp. UCD-FRSSP16_30]
MIKLLRVALVTVVCWITVIGCSAEVGDYKDQGPAFDLFGYFDGSVVAWGMVQDRSGKQTRRFQVELQGSVKQDTLTLHEAFSFENGEHSTRTWVIKRLPDGHYQGQADDIDGIATGVEVGNALHWTYDFELPRGESTVLVAFDDWLYRQDERHVFNLTSIRKLGIEFGTLTLFFQKNP